MQNIVIEEPYKFIPPHWGNWWPNVVQWFGLYEGHLRKKEGVVAHECRGGHLLKQSLDEGHGIVLAPNHCRTADPVVIGFLAKQVGCHVFSMASWHLFKQDRFTAWAIRKMGAFSVYREGLDRKALNTAIGMLEKAERPLVLFPEGSVTRTNDRLHALLDGVGFMARTAAKRRAKMSPPGKVVVHPVAIKYLFQGDIKETLDPVLTEIEHRLTWDPQQQLPLVKRISKIGVALLCLKEIEFFGRPQEGSLPDRLRQLIDRLLCPLEKEWMSSEQTGAVVPRVKNLRMAIVPEMIDSDMDEAERQRRWRQLGDIYLAQQISCYLPDYIDHPHETRLLETVERFEEDLTDKARVHGNLKVIIEVGERIEVSPTRDRSLKSDPLMTQVETDLQAMLDRLSLESPLYEEAE